MNFEEQNNGLFTVTFERREVRNVAFLSLHGSHLYGTDTPTSDLDYKGVFVAEQDDVILNRAAETYNMSTGGKEGSNTVDDIDLELIELRKFMWDLSKSQTYAVELLFANEESVQFSTPAFDFLRENTEDLLTSNMMSFVGYCVSQSKKYGLKGKRLRDTERAYEFLLKQGPRKTLEEVLDSFEKSVGYNENIFLVEKTFDDQDHVARLLEINGKQFDLAVPIRKITPSLNKTLRKYGKRARKAREGTDWKAISHAFRVAWQMEEIVKTGELKFPLEKAPEILKLKLGEVEYKDMQEALTELVEKIRTLEEKMEEKSWNSEKWDQWILNTYKEAWNEQ